MGPHFTRQAMHGARFDQSRIDQSYNSNHGIWMEFVREVVHDATQTLLDHHPSLIRIALQPLAPTGLRKSSYAKLDANELFVSNTITAIHDVYNTQMFEGRDPRINWELGWKAIRKTIINIQKEHDAREKNRVRPED